MDRPRLLTARRLRTRAAGTVTRMQVDRDYEPIQPRGGFDLRKLLGRIWAPIAFLIGLAAKFGFVFLKFAGLFASVWLYAQFGGWRFGIGLVALIFVHELGHMIAARAQGLEVTWPQFIPFLGAYVRIKEAGLAPLGVAVNALAGPFVGGLGAAVCWVYAERTGSTVMLTLAYTGFFLNLFNLIPIGIFDGGAVARAAREAWSMPSIRFERGVPMEVTRPRRDHGVIIAALYLALVALLVYGMWKTHVPHHRL